MSSVEPNKLYKALTLLVFLLLSTALGTLFRWNSQILHIPSFAVPMIVLFWLPYALAAAFSLSRSVITASRSEVRIVVLLIFFYMVAGLVLFVSRQYFSIGYLAIYCPSSIVAFFAINRYFATDIKPDTFALARVGNYQILEPYFSRLTLLDSPLPHGVDHSTTLVIDYSGSMSDPWKRAVTQEVLNNRPILSTEELYEILNERVLVGDFSGQFLFFTPDRILYFLVKRILDIALSSVLLILLFLPLVVILIAVRLSSEGLPIFSQERVGYRGRIFTLFKIRTMLEHQTNDSVNFTQDKDSRITPLGRWLRKYRIDEWPQFINVLRGDMSLIGPRPEQVPLARKFENEIPYYSIRHNVKPGITGWAQIKQGYVDSQAPTHTKLEYDLYYLKNAGLFLDLWISMHTLVVILLKKGAR